MADEPNPNPVIPATPAVPAAPPAAPVLTPEIVALIDAAATRGYNTGAKNARLEHESKAKPAPTPQPRTDTPDDALAILARRDAFDDAAGDLPLKASQRALMRDAVMRDRPDDVTAYVTRFVDRAGWSTSAAPAAPPPTALAAPAPVLVTPAVPGAPPVTDRAPVPPPYIVTDSTPLLSMKPHDREAVLAKYIAEKGVQEGNAKYADRYMAELTRDKIRVGSR